VSRGVIREAKERLSGSGVLFRDQWRARFGKSPALSLVRSWMAGESGHEAEERRRLKEALELRRLLWPECLALAVRRSPVDAKAELPQLLSELGVHFAIRAKPKDLSELHDRAVIRAAELTQSEVLLALGHVLLECMRSFPVWLTAVEDRQAWGTLLEEAGGLIKAGQGREVRARMRSKLVAIDSRLRKAIEAQGIKLSSLAP
jgi:DNA-binding FadR family transcriptional regulator